MKTIRQLLQGIILSGFLFTAHSVSAQKKDENSSYNASGYNNAIGFRAGEISGITYKHFMGGGDQAMEAILSLWPNAVNLAVLYEVYNETNAEGLNWYYGGGGHFSAGSGRIFSDWNGRQRRYYAYRYGYAGAAVGIDGIIGIEYKFPKAPFALSVDAKPFIEVNNAGGVYTYLDPGIGIKFAF